MQNSEKLLTQFNTMMLNLRTKAAKREGSVKDFRDHCWNQRCDFVRWADDNLSMREAGAAGDMCVGMALFHKRTWASVIKELVAINLSGREHLKLLLSLEAEKEATTKTPAPLIPADRYSDMSHNGVILGEGLEKDRQEWTKVIHWCRTSFHAARQERIWTPAVKAVLDQWENALASLALITKVDMTPLYKEHEKAVASFTGEYADD